jgi:uncharacterized membrane protein
MGEEPESPSKTEILGPNRIEALTDGVFAIVMTILVLELAVGEVVVGGSEELWQELVDHNMFSKIFSYIMTFIALGVLWIIHRYQFHYIEKSDGVMLWLSVFFLVSVALFPFFNAILEFEGALSIVLFSVNALIALIILAVFWWYASSKHRLLAPDTNEEKIKLIRTMPLPGLIGMSVAAVISVFSYEVALFLFFFLDGGVLHLHDRDMEPEIASCRKEGRCSFLRSQ